MVLFLWGIGKLRETWEGALKDLIELADMTSSQHRSGDPLRRRAYLNCMLYSCSSHHFFSLRVGTRVMSHTHLVRTW